MPTEMVKETTPTETMIARGSNYSAKQARLKKDEEELEALMKRQESSKEEEDQQEVETEEPQETEDKVEDSSKEPKEDTELSPEEKSFKKRYGDLRRHMASKEKEWEERFEALESQSSSVRPPMSDEDIESWASENPDVASIIETIADKKAAEKFAAADSRFKELDDAKYEATRTKAEIEIRKSHEDFDDLRDSDKFHDWVEEQPKWVRDALYENSDDAGSVIRVIDLYKVDNNLTISDKKSKAKEAAKTVSKKTRTTVEADETKSYLKESVVSKMTDKEFEDRYADIQEAMASGKFVYDISGRAR